MREWGLPRCVRWVDAWHAMAIRAWLLDFACIVDVGVKVDSFTDVDERARG